jgi:hypothetical protein
MHIATWRDDDIHYMIIPTNFLEWWCCMVGYGQHLVNLKKCGSQLRTNNTLL